jgi:two-component system sensor kinase FixL
VSDNGKSDQDKTKGQLLEEIGLLRERLQEAEEALDAIRSGRVDALVVSSESGDQIFTLQGAEHPYRVMVETMNEGAATLLEDGSIFYANPRLADILGEPVEALISSSILDFISVEDREIFQGAIEHGYLGSSRAELRFRRSDHSSVPVFISLSPTQVEGAQALSLVATELTERKRSEEIVAAERLARSILDQAAEIILVCDRTGKITLANQKALQIFARNPVYKHFDDALPLSYNQPEGRTFSITNVLNGESYPKVEAEYPASQGQNQVFLLSAAPLLKDQNQIIGCIVILTEITERKRAEEALRQSEKRFRSVVEGNMIGIVFGDNVTGDVLDANDEFLRIIGRSREELEAGQINWKKITPPEILEYEEQARMNLPIGAKRNTYEKAYLRPDGTRVPVIIGGSYLDDERRNSVAFVLEITDRKQAEELIRSYSARLERSNQELQDFAFIASHDLQEPLRKIEAFGSLIGKRSQMDETDLEYLARMQDAARRMRKMIEDLLNLSRVATRGKPYARVDLNEVAKKVVSDLEPRIYQTKSQVVIQALPCIEADEVQMYQLLQNLVANAIKYHRPDAPPAVQVGYHESTPGWVEIYVQDNGIGFDMKYADQIFQPFRRLHGRSEYEGSGIGLAICRKIVERHGGQISAQSAPGEGATFSILLPVKQTRNL